MGRSGVLQDDRNRAHIIFGGSLAAAQYHGIERVGDVTQRDDAAVIDRVSAAQYGLNIFGGVDPKNRFSELLGGRNLRFAALTDAQEAIVVTEHEWLAFALASPGVYKCDGKKAHFYPEPYKPDGAICDQCRSDDGPNNGPARVHLVHY